MGKTGGDGDDGGVCPDGGSGAAAVIGDEGRIVEASDSCAVVFRRPVEDIVGRTLSELESREILDEEFTDSLRQAETAQNRDESTFKTGIRPAPDEDPTVYEVRVDSADDSETVVSFHDVGTQYRYDETVDSLHGVTRELMTADSEREVFARISDAANEVLGFPGVGARMYDRETGTLEHVSFGGVVNEIDSRPPYDVDESPHGTAFRRGETVIEEIPDTGDPFDREVFSHTMYVPIGDYGVLSLGRVGGPFDRADVHFAEILAENAQAALQQVERKERLREQRRRLEERNERLDEFASVVSHDLRNPLGVAKGAIEMYHTTGDEEFIGDVEHALDRMDRIIDEMLELAQEGLDSDDVEPVSLATVARAAWRNVETDEVELQVEDDRVFEADGDRIRRLFENLFRNAMDHGDTATTVTVGTTVSGFFVADDGVGIDPDDRDDVFESGYTGADGGTGYGLAIVSRIVEEHGFSIDVTESEDGGARFEVTGIDVAPGS